MGNKENGGNFWFGFFLGGLIGGIIIFLMGTKEGKKLIERLIEKTETYEEELEEKVAKLQKRGEDLLTDVQAVKEKIYRRVDEGKEKVSDILVSKLDDVLTKIEDVQKKGVEITQDMHRNYFKKNGKTLTS